MVVIWSIRAKKELAKAFEYISQQSPKNAHKVVEALIDVTLALPENPQKHPLDKYKINNDGTWRAFEKYNYRISYHIKEAEIHIVRLRHTSRSPLNH